MVRTTVKVAKHGGSTVLKIDPRDAKRIDLRPGQRRTIDVLEETEPVDGILTRHGVTQSKIRRMKTALEDLWND